MKITDLTLTLFAWSGIPPTTLVDPGAAGVPADEPTAEE